MNPDDRMPLWCLQYGEWCLQYGDDPRVILWLQNNKPPFGWAPRSNAQYAYENMPEAKFWPLEVEE